MSTPPTSSKLAWVNAFEVVSASFLADGVPAVNLFGWRIPAQHPKGNRIAWIPGDPNGIVGTFLPPRNPGGEPRSLGTLGEVFTILINGHDPTEPENELLQYSIVRYLHDAWYRAFYGVAHGAFTIRSEAWVTTRTERRHGAALRIGVELQTMIPDEPYPGGSTIIDYPPDGDPRLDAEIEVGELDVSETIRVTGGDT